MAIGSEPNTMPAHHGEGKKPSSLRGVDTMRDFVARLVNWWEMSNQVLVTGLAYVVLLLSFIVCQFFSPSIIDALSILTGLMVLVVIPGWLVSGFVIPKNLSNLGTTVLVGLTLTLLQIHASFSLSLLLNVHIPLIIWLPAFSSAVVSACLLLYFVRGRSPGGNPLWSKITPDLLLILLVAIAIRLGLWFLAQGAIAPDAALYADYARALVEGNFESNVLNEGALTDLWNGTQGIAHQGFVYLFALSWLLIEPSVSGPTLVLGMVGVLLIIPCQQLASQFFGKVAAKWTGLILAVHPLFVFHSAVAYGPEITSLFFMLYAVLLLLGNGDGRSVTFLLAGIVIGLVEVIWYPNFYIGCILLMILIVGSNRFEKRETLFFMAMICFAVLSRVLIYQLALFVICWLLIIGCFLLLWRFKPEMKLHRTAPFFMGIIGIFGAWYWPLFVQQLGGGGINSVLGTKSALSMFMALFSASINLELLGRFVFFSIFHLSPILCIIIPVAFLRGEKKCNAILFLLAGIIAGGGALVVLAFMSKETLLPVYLFSDSRFFLFPITMFIISMGAFFEKRPWRDFNESSVLPRLKPSRRQRRLVLVAGLIILGFAPSYAVIPSGLALVNVEERFGWIGLSSLIEQIGDQDTVFLAERPRELSWLTGRRSATLILSSAGLGSRNVSDEVIALATDFNASFLVMDDYTVIRWGISDFLQRGLISIGTSVALNISAVIDSNGNLSAYPMEVLTLIGQSEENAFGNYARVFEFETKHLVESWNGSVLDIGWEATNEGVITNSSGEAHLIIASGQNHTSTQRANSFDLDVEVSGGFMLCDVEQISATVACIELWDEDGNFIRFAENFGSGLYYCPLGEVTIGDIRIVVEGDSGDSIIVRSISVWQVENP